MSESMSACERPCETDSKVSGSFVLEVLCPRVSSDLVFCELSYIWYRSHLLHVRWMTPDGFEK